MTDNTRATKVRAAFELMAAYTRAGNLCRSHALHCRNCSHPIIDPEGNPGYLGEACAVGAPILQAYIDVDKQIMASDAAEIFDSATDDELSASYDAACEERSHGEPTCSDCAVTLEYTPNLNLYFCPICGQLRQLPTRNTCILCQVPITSPLGHLLCESCEKGA